MKLERLKRSNLEKYLSWRNHDSVRLWCRQPDMISFEHHERWFNWQDTDPNTVMYEIVVDNKPVGVCGLTSIDWINRRAELSLYIAPECQIEIQGKKAYILLLKKAFDTYNLHSVWGEVFEGNPCLATVSVIGFKYEGKRNDFYFRGGAYISAYLFGITRADFKKLHGPTERQQRHSAGDTVSNIQKEPNS